jgi:hypothetical protein
MSGLSVVQIVGVRLPLDRCTAIVKTNRANLFSNPLWRRSEPHGNGRVGRLGNLVLRQSSKIKLVNILFREEIRLPEQDVVPLDLDRSEPPGRQAGGAWLQSTFFECAGGLGRQVA